MPLSISSLQNSRIKNVIRLNKRAERNRQRLMVVEGQREIQAGLDHEYLPCEVFVCPDLVEGEAGYKLATILDSLERAGRIELIVVTSAVYRKIAYRGESGGFIALFPYLNTKLQILSNPQPTFVLVVQGAEKPGNLGAILRTADSAGVDCVIVCDGGTDLHNPNVTRASLGSIFSVPIAETPTAAAIEWLRIRGLQILAAGPQSDVPYTSVNMQLPLAIVTGNEADGLDDCWLNEADAHISIPMFGYVDSLNLSTSTAILLYEVVRQRN